MSFPNHKRVTVEGAKPTALCGAQDWISLISIDHHVDCKKCLKIMRKKGISDETRDTAGR